MLKKIVMVVATVVICTFIYASTKPDTFRHVKSITIFASPTQVFKHVNDLRAWAAWSPFEKMDPNMKKTLSDATIGVGASASWEGNFQVGAGRMEITQSVVPSKIGIHLSITKPMKEENEIEFTFEPVGDGTRVTWGMSGETNFAGKLFCVLVNCEKMVGEEFTDGLNMLKVAVEKPSQAPGGQSVATGSE